MLDAGIIRISKSPWSAPVILIKKKDGNYRMCVDFRKLNAQTITQSWPIPRVQDILDDLAGSVWFSSIDLKSGFWQILMEDDSIEKSAFSTPEGHYEFLPFGLKNAPSEFSRIMFLVLGDLNFVKKIFDDVIIHSITFDEHMSHLVIVFERLGRADLRLNQDKCVFCAREILVLGHIISRNQAWILKKLPPSQIERALKTLRMLNALLA